MLTYYITLIRRKSDMITRHGNAKGRGRPKLIWDVIVKNDWNLFSLTEHL